MKGVSDEIIGRAEQLVAALKSLDYKRIAAHDLKEVDRLNQILKRLAIKPVDDDPLANYAQQQPETIAKDVAKDSAIDDAEAANAAREQRRKILIERLAEEGFGNRLGKVYNSFAKERNTPFERMPHSRGIPKFDLVLAPDFAPVAGMHGIFIVGNWILSIVLPSDTQPSGDWQVLKKKSFANAEEMTEMVTLIAAGFDLP